MTALNEALFSTKDKDNDRHVDKNCGLYGGWWYEDCHGPNVIVYPNGFHYDPVKIRPLNYNI